MDGLICKYVYKSVNLLYIMILPMVTVGLCLCHVQPNKLMQSILSCAQLEDAVEEERLLLSSAEVDVEDVESFKHQLKGLWYHCLYLLPLLK